MPPTRDDWNRLVVGLDGSDQALSAATWAIRLAKAASAEVVAVFAISPPTYVESAVAGLAGPTVPPQFDQEWRADMTKEFEDHWCQPIRDAGVRLKTVMRDGRPASVIAQVAEEVDADIIVVGRRGRGGVAELLLGSFSHELVLHSKRPVLVVSGGR